MPGTDKTGPMGRGALTGRKTGRCLEEAGSKTTGFFQLRGMRGSQGNEARISRPRGGSGFGRGFGRNSPKGTQGKW